MIKIITKDSKISKRNMMKGLNIMKKFARMFRIIVTGREKSIQEMASRSNIFCCLRQFSSVVELFIGFLTSGLSFVKLCWGQIIW